MPDKLSEAVFMSYSVPAIFTLPALFRESLRLSSAMMRCATSGSWVSSSRSTSRALSRFPWAS